MRTRAITIAFAMVLVMLPTASVTAATPPLGEWHRLNPGVENEHERLRCVEVSAHWSCAYDKLAEPGYHLDATVGMFQGRNVTSTWTCPGWLGSDICDNVIAVYEGRATYFPDEGGHFRVDQDYIVTEVAGRPVLIQYWIDQFACPWFRTFDEAVAANPTSDFDCVIAP